MNKWHRTGTALVGVALAVGALAACGPGGGGGGVKGNTTIKICTDFPVSGAEASAGKPAENGVTLAIEQANSKKTISGYTLVPVHYDDVGASGKHDPDKGASNIRQAIGDALIAGCIGPFNSSVAQSEMPIANQAPLALISPSNTNPSLTKPSYGQTATYRPSGKVTYFRVCATDDKQGPAGADYLYNSLHLTKVYVIDDTETYGKGIADLFEQEFKKDGGTVLGRQGVDSKTTTDYKPILTAAAALHPDAIYFGGIDNTGGESIAIQMRQVPGLEKVILAGGDGLQTDDMRKTTGAAGVGTLVTVASVNPDKLPSAQQFISDFHKRFTDPAAYGAYSANGYDAGNIMIQAIKRAVDGGAANAKDSSDTDGAKTFRQAVIDQLAKTNYSGVTGTTTFDENGDTTNRFISIYKLGTSDWEFVDQLKV